MKLFSLNLLATGALSLMISSVSFAQTKAPEPDYTLTGNLTAITDYRYRGISQTRLRPALQGTIDFAHKSGFYAGAFLTNIKWIRDAGGKANVELDLYGGYKGTIVEGLGYDVGILQYVYPSNRLNPNANTTEVYGGLTYKEYSLKYYNSVTNIFGFANSKNSGYLDFTATFDLGAGWGVVGHIGHQAIRKSSQFSYTDYKIAGTKDIDGLILTAAVVGTDTKEYKGPAPSSRNLGRPSVVLSIGKNF
jgi:uncharacterized protein (TIGR02001 family)